MAQDRKICRVCLEVLGKSDPCFEFINNDAVIQRLSLISFNTVKNLDLTDDPVICASCDGALKELARFKEKVIANEFKIQCNQKNDSNMFLDSVSKDIQAICRLCLKVPDTFLEKSWPHYKKLLAQCNIRMNENIIMPAKICNLCFAALKGMGQFMSLCTMNERLIADFGAAKGKLTLKDLRTISMNRGCSTSQKGNAAREKSSKKKSTSNVSGKINNKESVDQEQKPVEHTHSVKQVVESFNVKRTPNTYKNKTRAATLAETPSTNQARRSINQLINRKYVLKKMNEQLRQMHTSIIDTSPLTDLADITLDVNKHNFAQQEEPTSECNVTQELIDVLEGRLNDKDINYATQELLDVLEGRLDDDEAGKKGNKEATDIDLEPNTEKGKETINSNVKNKNIEIVIGPKKRGPKKKTVAKPTETVEIPNSITEKIKKGARQKTIQEMFNNPKLLGSSNTATAVSADHPVSIQPDNNEAENTNVTNNANTESTDNSPATDIVLAPVEAMSKATSGRKKKINKITEESDKTGPPKKRAKRAPKKTEESVTNNGTNNVPEIKQENEDKELEDRPVVVTIIKSKRRTNKAQLDKTWQELTGKSAPNNTGKVAELPEGLEIELVKKKKGRPAKSESQNPRKKPKKVIWLYCQMCPFKTYAQRIFVQHQLIHNVMSDLPVLQCNMCRFTTTNSEFLQVHKIRDHESNNCLSYKCVFCDEVFKKKISCMYHSLRHDDRDVASQFYCMVYNAATLEECFECFQCDYQNVDESPMPDHVIDHTIEKVKVPLLPMLKCDICPYKTKSQELLKRHDLLRHAYQKKPVKIEPKEENHDEEGVTDEYPILKCDKCHYVTRHKRSLSNHKGLKHNRLLLPPPPAEPAAMGPDGERQIFYCNECSYSTHRKMNMPRHALVHKTKANMEFLECPHCIFETKHRRSYTRHMEVLHGVIV